MASKPPTTRAVLRFVAVLALFLLFASTSHARGPFHGPPDTDTDSDSDSSDDNTNPTFYDPTVTTNPSSSSPTDTSSSNPHSGSGSGSGSGSNSDSQAGYLGFDTTQASHYRTVHGILASVAFLAIFPLGASFVRIVPGRWAWVVHASAQGVGLVLFVCAAALGIWLLVNVQLGGRGLLDIPSRQAHPILGILLLTLIISMPVLGFLHHSSYKKYQRRTTISHVHIWLGRILIPLGMVTGGLGLKQAGASEDVKVGYAVVAAVAGALWMFFAVWGEVRRRGEEKQKMAMAAGRGPGGVLGDGDGNGPGPYLPGGAGVIGAAGAGAGYATRGDAQRETRRIGSDDASERVSEESIRRPPQVGRNKSVRGDAVSEISSRA